MAIETQTLVALALASPVVITFVAGFVEFVKAIFDGIAASDKPTKLTNFRKAVIILGAAAVGGFVGAFAVDGLNVWYGIVAGLAASGTITIAQNIGNKTVTPVNL